MLHRRVLGYAPAPIEALFPFASPVNAPHRTRLTSRLHNRQLEDPASGVVTEMFRRSLFGHIAIYNRLPQAIVELSDIKVFQRRLQRMVCKQTCSGNDSWKVLLSTRNRSSDIAQFQRLFLV